MAAHVSVKYHTLNPKDINALFVIDVAKKREMANDSIDALREILKPLRRTGDLEYSWQAFLTPAGFDLESRDWAASSIQQGFAKAPPKETLLDWMSRKPEFSGMDEKEKSQVAFAIRRTIISKASPGRTSTIGPLSPSGERSFDYFSTVVKRVQTIIKDKIKT